MKVPEGDYSCNFILLTVISITCKKLTENCNCNQQIFRSQIFHGCSDTEKGAKLHSYLEKTV